MVNRRRLKKSQHLNYKLSERYQLQVSLKFFECKYYKIFKENIRVLKILKKSTVMIIVVAPFAIVFLQINFVMAQNLETVGVFLKINSIFYLNVHFLNIKVIKIIFFSKRFIDILIRKNLHHV